MTLMWRQCSYVLQGVKIHLISRQVFSIKCKKNRLRTRISSRGTFFIFSNQSDNNFLLLFKCRILRIFYMFIYKSSLSTRICNYNNVGTAATCCLVYPWNWLFVQQLLRAGCRIHQCSTLLALWRSQIAIGGYPDKGPVRRKSLP